MAPKLYVFKASPPVRATQMFAKQLGLNIETKELDMFKQEHLTPEYLKLNPTHTVPTLVDDDGFVLWESHAILVYLAQKYGKNDSLYPKDLKQRAIVNQRLNFDNGVAFACLGHIVKPLVRKQKNSLDQDDKDNTNEVYGFVENFLTSTQWIAGNNPTIADYSLVATITALNLLISVDTQKYPKLISWLRKCENLPGYEAGIEGLEVFRNAIKMFLGPK